MTANLETSANETAQPLTMESSHPKAQSAVVKVAELYPSPLNLRKNYGNIDELAESIQEHGILVPLIVRADGIPITGYEIIAGHRRYQAALKLGLDIVPVHIHNLDDDQAQAMIIVENLQREDVTMLEQAEGIRRLRASGLMREEIAKKIGKSVVYVDQCLALERLSAASREQLEQGHISAAHAVELVSLKPADQKKCLRAIAKDGLSSKALREFVKGLKSQQPAKPKAKSEPRISTDSHGSEKKRSAVSTQRSAKNDQILPKYPGTAQAGSMMKTLHLEELRTLVLCRVKTMPRTKLEKIVSANVLRVAINNIPALADAFGVNVKAEVKRMEVAAKKAEAKKSADKSAPKKAAARPKKSKGVKVSKRVAGKRKAAKR